MVTKENQRFLLVYKVMNDIVSIIQLTTRRITTVITCQNLLSNPQIMR
jgi:hypothetical protein